MSEDGNIGDMDEDKLLVAEYALGLLSAAEHARLAERLKSEPELAAELRLWQQRLSSLDDKFDEVTAPSAVLGKIEARLFGKAETNGFWNSLALWRGFAAAGVALAAIAIGINLVGPGPATMGATQLVAAINAENSNVSFVALYDPVAKVVHVTSLSGDAVPDHDYELWAIQGGNAPISMGVIPVGQKVDVKVSDKVLAGFGPGTVLAVTLEAKGGSPTGDPQGTLVAKGAAIAV